MKNFCTLSFTSTVNFPDFDIPYIKPKKGTLLGQSLRV